MASSALYINVAGSLAAEVRDGVRKEYVSDSLGSTVALVGSTGSATDTFEYWPYGEELSRTGSNPTPFTWVGTLGYFKDAAARFYVRMRSYVASAGSWTRVDPMWPMQSAYGYVGVMSSILSMLRDAAPNGCGLVLKEGQRALLLLVRLVLHLLLLRRIVTNFQITAISILAHAPRLWGAVAMMEVEDQNLQVTQETVMAGRNRQASRRQLAEKAVTTTSVLQSDRLCRSSARTVTYMQGWHVSS